MNDELTAWCHAHRATIEYATNSVRVTVRTYPTVIADTPAFGIARLQELQRQREYDLTRDITDEAMIALARLPQAYPTAVLTRDTPGNRYMLMVGDTVIFHSIKATDALACVTRYVRERENSPTLPVGVIDGIYD